MRAAVVLFPGSNAETELIDTLRYGVGVTTQVVWHQDHELPEHTDLVALPGGFAHGDYLRCGAMAKTSPIIAAIKRHAEGGGYVLGICNGFQILTEAGLLPGALTRNQNLRFECRNVFVKPVNGGPFTMALPKVLTLPIAHAEGRYQADHDTLGRLEHDRNIGLRYCSREGADTSDANPNGSIGDIAGIYGGPNRNVFGLMPHPERYSLPHHGGTDGLLLFKAMVESAANRAST